MRRSVIIVLVLLALVTSVACGPKPISKETLDYFYGLVNQQYWQLAGTGLTLNDEYGTKQLVIASTGTSDKQQYILFGDVTVTASNTKIGPTDALIKAKVFDGTTEKDMRVRVDDANLATLQNTLALTFESKMQQEQRLANVAAVAAAAKSNESQVHFKIAKSGVTTQYGREVWCISVQGFKDDSSAWSEIKDYGYELALKRWEENKSQSAVAVYFFDDESSVLSPEVTDGYRETLDQLPHCIARVEIWTNAHVVSQKYPFFDSKFGLL